MKVEEYDGYWMTNDGFTAISEQHKTNYSLDVQKRTMEDYQQTPVDAHYRFANFGKDRSGPLDDFRSNNCQVEGSL